MIEPIEINWSVFERGAEVDSVRKLYNEGSIKMIPSVIVDMTQEKEIEIQKMANAMNMDYLNVESEVAREFKEEERKLGRFPISNPTEEAYWQRRFDEEREQIRGSAVNAEPTQRLSTLRIGTEKPKCTTCGKDFSNNGLLTMHQRTHETLKQGAPATANT